MGLYQRKGKRGTVWESRVQYKGERFKKSWGPVSKSIALEKDAQFRASIYSGEYQKRKREQAEKKNRITLNEFRDYYLNYYRLQWREKSFKRVKTSMEPLCKELGEKYLDEILPLDIERFKRKRKEAGANPATINRDLNTLSNLYRIAIRDGKAKDNPVREVQRYKEKPSEMWVLTDDEEDRLLKECDRIKEDPPYLRNLVTVALYSGMRLNEIFSMVPKHIDFENKVLNVPDSKTNKPRKIPINKTLEKALQSALEVTRGPWVFSNSQGDRIKHLKNGFWKAVERAGLSRTIDGKKIRFRFHDLRHTFGSRLGQKGYDLKSIMEIMGHSTPKVALRYQHPTDEHKREMVNSLDKIMSQEKISN